MNTSGVFEYCSNLKYIEFDNNQKCIKKSWFIGTNNVTVICSINTEIVDDADIELNFIHYDIEPYNVNSADIIFDVDNGLYKLSLNTLYTILLTSDNITLDSIELNDELIFTPNSFKKITFKNNADIRINISQHSTMLLSDISANTPNLHISGIVPKNFAKNGNIGSLTLHVNDICESAFESATINDEISLINLNIHDKAFMNATCELINIVVTEVNIIGVSAFANYNNVNTFLNVAFDENVNGVNILDFAFYNARFIDDILVLNHDFINFNNNVFDHDIGCDHDTLILHSNSVYTNFVNTLYVPNYKSLVTNHILNTGIMDTTMLFKAYCTNDSAYIVDAVSTNQTAYIPNTLTINGETLKVKALLNKSISSNSHDITSIFFDGCESLEYLGSKFIDSEQLTHLKNAGNAATFIPESVNVFKSGTNIQNTVWYKYMVGQTSETNLIMLDNVLVGCAGDLNDDVAFKDLNISTIYNDTFINKLLNIVDLENVEYIYSKAFNTCNIDTLKLTNSIKYIASDAFTSTSINNFYADVNINDISYNMFELAYPISNNFIANSDFAKVLLSNSEYYEKMFKKLTLTNHIILGEYDEIDISGMEDFKVDLSEHIDLPESIEYINSVGKLYIPKGTVDISGKIDISFMSTNMSTADIILFGLSFIKKDNSDDLPILVCNDKFMMVYADPNFSGLFAKRFKHEYKM